jgi:8-amino-7-oxononanoate synthase
VVGAFKNAADRYGVGSGSAHLICGHSEAHHALEEELAEFTGRERALLFSTGYMANLGAISALIGNGDTVIEDRLNHASLIDGGLLSGARFKRYRHGDLEHLTNLLEDASGKKLLVTDGVFSMDGDLAPLPDLAKIAQDQNAWLMVDDAHGLGVLGEQGGGVLEHYGLTQTDVPVLVGTLGKAFGTFGAFVAGSDILIELLIQKARTYIYTTALPPAVAEATRASLKIARAESWRRDRLKQLTERFRQGTKQLGLELIASPSPIQPILIGDSRKATALSEALLAAGFLVSAIRPPTVPQGSARLRVTFSAAQEEWQVDRLLNELDRLKV